MMASSGVDPKACCQLRVPVYATFLRPGCSRGMEAMFLVEMGSQPTIPPIQFRQHCDEG